MTFTGDSSSRDPIISVKGLTVGYGGEPVVRNVSFDVLPRRDFRCYGTIRLRKNHSLQSHDRLAGTPGRRSIHRR